MSIRRTLVATGLALALAALGAGVALADGGPHGDFDKTMSGDATTGTDKCAACHRPHQGVSAGKLLKRATPYELCVTCHDGTVSRLDVLDGIKLTATTSSRPAGIVPAGATTLNGGGFEYVSGTAVTSKHNVKRSTTDTSYTQPWGYLTDTGAQSGTITALTCTSCHNPHGSANYRMFVESNNGRTVSVLAYYDSAFTKQEGARGLEGTEGTDYPADKYSDEYYGSAGLTTSGGYQPQTSAAASAGNASTNGFTLLCGTCHSSYPSPSDGDTALPTGADNPWTITKYRHRMEMEYTDWLSPKLGSNPVGCNPETQSYNPPTGGACGTAGQYLPALRLASNTTVADKIVTCLTCHRAHGTATSMTGWALKDTYGGSSPDALSPAQTADDQLVGGTSKSMLLFTNNRAMCEACHQW